jgi:antitoxin ParD1/3/4
MANIDKINCTNKLQESSRNPLETDVSSTLNLSLTDELRAFVNQNCGDGTLYATPSEFVRDVLREKKERLEATEIRDAILEGYQDAIEGRITQYRGNLRQLLKKT